MKLISLLLFLQFSLFAQDYWIPPKITVTADGRLSQNLVLPNFQQEGPSPTQDFEGGFYPLLNTKFVSFKRVFAIDSDTQNLAPSEKGVLVSAQSKNGYRVIEQSDLGISVPIPIMQSEGLPVTFSIGVTPSIGKGWTSSRFVQTFEETKKVKALKLPIDDITMNEWRPKDEFYYHRNKGISVNASVGAKGFSVGAAVFIDSVWNVNIDRIDQNKFSISYMNALDKGVKVYGSATIAGFSIDKLWGESKSFFYSFDLSSKRIEKNLKIETNYEGKKEEIIIKEASVRKAFLNAMKGDLVLADMLSKEKGFGVEKISETDTRSKTLKRSAYFSIPVLLSITSQKGKSNIVNNSKLIQEDILAEQLIGVYAKEFQTSGMLSKNAQENLLFTGNFQQITPLAKPEGKVLRRYSANFKYLYMRNKVDADKLQLELKRLRFLIGQMKELKDLKVPEKEIGSLKIEVDLLLSDMATDELMNMAQKTSEQDFSKEAINYLEGFFKNVGDAAEETCKDMGLEYKISCQPLLRKQTNDGMKEAYRALRVMHAEKENQNYDNFVKAFADFGQAMSTNRFSLKTILRMVKFEKVEQTEGEFVRPPDKVRKAKSGRIIKIPFEIHFSMEGTNLAPYKRILYKAP